MSTRVTVPATHGHSADVDLQDHLGDCPVDVRKDRPQSHRERTATASMPGECTVMIQLAAVLAHLFADVPVDPSRDTLHVWETVASPLLTAGEYLIPAGVALSSLHKVMQHQESGSGFLVDMLVKGGGAVLVIQLVKSFLHV
jgi:hypothetical protein